MKSKGMTKLVLFSLSLGIGGSIASAAPLCTALAQNAAQFQSLGNGGCEVGDKVFFNFTYDYTLTDSNGDSLPPGVPGTNVAVQFSFTNASTFLPLVSFIGNWHTANGQQGDVRIQYSVSAPAVHAMIGASMGISGFVSDTDPDNEFASQIAGAEPVCCPGAGSSSVELQTELDPPVSPSGLVFVTSFDSKSFAPATHVDITKNIFISAGTGTNQGTLTRIDQGLVELQSVPEPVSFLMFGSGLIAIVSGMKCIRKFKHNL